MTTSDTSLAALVIGLVRSLGAVILSAMLVAAASAGPPWSRLVRVDPDGTVHMAGMFQGFFYNLDVPESRESYDVIVRFFGSRVGRS